MYLKINVSINRSAINGIIDKMKIVKSHKLSIAFIIKVIAATVGVGVTGALLGYVAVSGLLPVAYLLLAIAAAIVFNGLVVFLLFKRFKRWNPFAKVIAGVIIALMIFGSAAAYTGVSTGLGLLDRISGGENSVKVETSQPFNVYISGIDTYGDIQSVSRSDVNIVATINPNSHTVLLTTIPRDSYVPIALGGQNQKDKLTHAGNYGVESSMKTVANLLETPIDAYVRINFTSFIMGIDKIGGITVSNPTAFTASGEQFAQGDIFLDGKRALIFARERKSLEGGDQDRGKNQQRVIEGFINKVLEARSFSQYEALLTSVGDSVDTNMSGDSLKELINQQIQRGGAWKTSSIALTGKGQTGGLPSFAMPSASLYMFVIDPASLKEAQGQIAEALKV